MSRLGLRVVGRVVAVVLAARELARRPVARGVVLLAVEPAFQRVELLTGGRVPIDLGIQRLRDGLRGPPEALLVDSSSKRHAAFGGYKESGFGRETHKMMLDHYQQTKNLLVSYDTAARGLF